MRSLIVIGIVGLLVFLGAFLLIGKSQNTLPVPTSVPSFTTIPSPTPTSTPSPTPKPTPTPTPKPPAKIIFGIGSQAGPAMDYKLVKEAPVHMLTSWYNGPSDLVWMRVQQNDLIPRLYKN